MKTLRLVRNVAVLFILLMALLYSRQPLHAQSVGNSSCIFGSGTVGYNCTLNANGTCNSSKCEAGQPCNNGVCLQGCVYKKGHSCQFDASGHCHESPCGRGFFCFNSGCA